MATMRVTIVTISVVTRVTISKSEVTTNARTEEEEEEEETEIDVFFWRVEIFVNLKKRSCSSPKIITKVSTVQPATAFCCLIDFFFNQFA